MKILITGGAGFIGSHISRLLLDLGHQVTIYDNLSTSDEDSVDPRAKLIKADINNQKLLEKSLPGSELVVHLASKLQVNESVKKPLLYAKNNILGSIHLLEAMRKTGVKRIIFSSSATVYGHPKKLPVTEQSPVMAVNPYGVTKVAVENLLSAYHYLYGFDVAILRYFNPYGPDPHYQGKSLVIPNLISKALNKQPVPLFWKGNQIRDFIYVSDLARAHLAVLPLKGLNIFNVGTETGVKVTEIVNKLSDIFGYPLKVQDLGERAGDVAANYASSKALTRATGWKAQVSLEEGLRKTVAFFKSLR